MSRKAAERWAEAVGAEGNYTEWASGCPMMPRRASGRRRLDIGGIALIGER